MPTGLSGSGISKGNSCSGHWACRSDRPCGPAGSPTGPAVCRSDRRKMFSAGRISAEASAFSPEEIHYECGAFPGHNPSLNLGFRMKQGRGVQGISSLGIERTIDNAPDLRPVQRSGTHRTRLYCDVECAISEIFSAHGFSRSRDGDHLRMCRRIMEPFRHVVSTSDDTATAHDDSPDRNLILLQGQVRLFQCLCHVFLVNVHVVGSIMSAAPVAVPCRKRFTEPCRHGKQNPVERKKAGQ